MSRWLVALPALFWLLSGLFVFALYLAFIGHETSPSELTFHLLGAHAALLILTISASIGLLLKRRWGWWMGLATFVLLAAMAVRAVASLDTEARTLAAVYALCAAPGACFLKPGRLYREELR